MTDLEETLVGLERDDIDADERDQFYVLVDQMWLSEQIASSRMEMLMKKYPRFSDYMKSRRPDAI